MLHIRLSTNTIEWRRIKRKRRNARYWNFCIPCILSHDRRYVNARVRHVFSNLILMSPRYRWTHIRTRGRFLSQSTAGVAYSSYCECRFPRACRNSSRKRYRITAWTESNKRYRISLSRYRPLWSCRNHIRIILRYSRAAVCHSEIPLCVQDAW